MPLPRLERPRLLPTAYSTKSKCLRPAHGTQTRPGLGTSLPALDFAPHSHQNAGMPLPLFPGHVANLAHISSSCHFPEHPASFLQTPLRRVSSSSLSLCCTARKHAVCAFAQSVKKLRFLRHRCHGSRGVQFAKSRKPSFLCALCNGDSFDVQGLKTTP